MACGSCGNKREALLREHAQRAAGIAAPAQDNARDIPARQIGDCAEALLRYMDELPFKVRGESSGQHYDFTPQSALQFVDSRDVASLMRTGRFRQLA